jgi:hypothetical protein
MADDLRFVISVDDRDLIRTQREQKKFQANLVLIEKAFRDGKISAFRYNTEIVKQSSQLSKLGGTYQKAASEVRTYAASLRKATDAQLANTAATVMGGKKMNRFGMISQQVGYQVGDFFVQVQSGTSALVAFGQQGTQLAGLLPGIYGAVIGIGLAIGTMLARSFLQAKDAMSDFQDLSNSFAPAMKKLSEGIKDTRLEVYKLVTGIKDTNQAIGQQALEYQKALQQTNQFLAAQDGLSRIQKVRAQGLKVFGLTIVKSDQERVDLLEKQNDEYSKLNDRAEQLRKKEEDRKNFLEDQLEIQERIRDAEQAIEAAQDRQASKASITYAIEEDKLDLLRQLAAGTITQADLEDQLLRNKLKLEYSLLDNADALIARRVEQVRQGRELTAEIKEQISQTKLKEQALKRIEDSFNKQRDSMVAQGDLLKHEVFLRKVYKDETYIQERLEQKKLDLYIQQNNLNQDQADRLRAAHNYLLDQKQTLEDINDQEKARLNLLSVQQKMIGVGVASGRGGDPRQQGTRYQQEFGYKTIDELIAEFESKNKINKSTQKAIDLTRELTDAQKQQVAIADSVSGAFGDFFMGLVDGTTSAKDAFRSMAADIIQQLYRILVVEQLVQSIKGAVTGAFAPASAAGTEGTVAPPKRPTKIFGKYEGGGYTGSGPRSGGLDGKGGFMAMLHPRETVVDHTKGQGAGGDVNIVQNFSFSANGDDSVRKIIAQAAPQIAKMTQQQIVDSRRRGGAMKAAFGG